MKNRSIVLAVSVLCVGIMIMPYTVSLFGGSQHGWVAGGDVACLDCHQDISEPGAGYMHSTLGTGQAYCKSCHQLGAAGSSDGVTGEGGFDDEHAAVTVECLDCHEADNVNGEGTADVWWSGTEAALAASEKAFINNATEAHSNMTGTASLVEGAWASDYLAGNNEACIACHTNVTLGTGGAWLQYTAQTLNITASEDLWGNWTVTFRADP